MADVHSKEVRSYNMSRIRSSNTKPEILVRKFLHSKGLRFRLNYSKLPGRPDIVLPKHKVAVLVHGCFWHGHQGCKGFKLPESNKDYWHPKIEKNISKDIDIKKQLEMLGWKVIVIWECDLKNKYNAIVLDKLFDSILNNKANLI